MMRLRSRATRPCTCAQCAPLASRQLQSRLFLISALALSATAALIATLA